MTLPPASSATRPAPALAAAALLTALAVAGPAAAQQRDSLPGVQLGLVYEGAYTPALAVQPFGGRFGGQAAAPRVEAIIARDLRYSDRYRVLDSLPRAMTGSDGSGSIDYALWDRLGADWLLTGALEGSGSGFVLVLRLHDIVDGTLRDEGRFTLPREDEAGFRMAVHRVSDEVVRWTHSEPGMAASRIAFSMRTDPGTTEIYLVDSDGENLRRLTTYGSTTLSPSWSPDGARLLYMSYHAMEQGRADNTRVYEMEVATGRDRVVDVAGEGMYITPVYSPDGATIAFSLQSGRRSGLFTYDLSRDCCLTNLTEGRYDDISPSYAPDGRRLAFMTTRFGSGSPQVMEMSSGGGSADVVSPFDVGRGGFYAAPDWAPFGGHLAFHGRIGRTGRYHILVARMDGRRRVLRQLTWEGNNEDPSWAPDGRHIVFAGERSWGKGLFVVDSGTGRIRALLRGVDVTVPDWSPALPGR